MPTTPLPARPSRSVPAAGTAGKRSRDGSYSVGLVRRRSSVSRRLMLAGGPPSCGSDLEHRFWAGWVRDSVYILTMNCLIVPGRQKSSGRRGDQHLGDDKCLRDHCRGGPARGKGLGNMVYVPDARCSKRPEPDGYTYDPWCNKCARYRRMRNTVLYFPYGTQYELVH